MRIVKISDKVHFVRHWFRWYRVMRGGEDWRPLEIKRYVKPKTIKNIQESLEKGKK